MCVLLLERPSVDVLQVSLERPFNSINDKSPATVQYLVFYCCCCCYLSCPYYIITLDRLCTDNTSLSLTVFSYTLSDI